MYLCIIYRHCVNLLSVKVYKRNEKFFGRKVSLFLAFLKLIFSYLLGKNFINFYRLYLLLFVLPIVSMVLYFFYKFLKNFFQIKGQIKTRRQRM